MSDIEDNEPTMEIIEEPETLQRPKKEKKEMSEIEEKELV